MLPLSSVRHPARATTRRGNRGPVRPRGWVAGWILVGLVATQRPSLGDDALWRPTRIQPPQPPVEAALPTRLPDVAVESPEADTLTAQPQPSSPQPHRLAPVQLSESSTPSILPVRLAPTTTESPHVELEGVVATEAAVGDFASPPNTARRLAPIKTAPNTARRLAPIRTANRLPAVWASDETSDELLPPVVATDDLLMDQAGGETFESATEPLAHEISLRTEPDTSLGINQPQLRYPDTELLELHQAIYLALANAPEITVLRSDVGIAVAEVQRQDAAFDWNVFVNSTWDDRNNPVASALDGVQDRLLNRDLNNEFGLRQSNQYGGSINVGQLANFADSNSQFFIPRDQAVAQLGVTYEQPLLRGGGREVARSRFELAVAESLVTQESFVEGLQGHLISTINAYWDLASSRATCAIQRRNMQRAHKVVELVKKRADVDVGPAQLARAEATLAARQTELLRSEYAVVLSQEQLMRLMLGPAFDRQTTKELVPITDFLAKTEMVEVDLQQQIALQNRPEIRRSLQQIKQAAIEQGVAKNQLLPLLGLTLSMSNRGLAGDRQFGLALGDQFDLNQSTYGVGLAYEMPIGNRAARANLSQAKLRMTRLQSQLEATIADVTLQVRNAAHLLALAIQELELSTVENSLAQRELAVIEHRYLLLIDGDSVGLIYLDNLLLTQERLAAAELRLVEAALRCKRAEYELQRATGQLLRQSPGTF